MDCLRALDFESFVPVVAEGQRRLIHVNDSAWMHVGNTLTCHGHESERPAEFP
jgi:hypothetical protein